MNLLDSDIFIDLLRERPPSVEWLATTNEVLAVPGMVALELVVGCRDKSELKRLRLFMADFMIVWLQETDMERALADYAPLALSDGIGRVDALIAATATGLNATLYTFNTKHFRAAPGLIIRQPYVRR